MNAKERKDFRDKALKLLPEGWSLEEPYSEHPHMFVVHRDEAIGGGFVSIDCSERVFCGGCVPVIWNMILAVDTRPEYRGRNWKQDLIQDAISWLDKVMTA